MVDFPVSRPRRLRANATVRSLVRETCLHVDELVLPIFVRAGEGIEQSISSMPGQFQWSADRLPKLLAELRDLSLFSLLLFGIPAEKDALGASGCSDHGAVQNAIKVIKAFDPRFYVMADVCLCEYTDHGHCGVVTRTAGDQAEIDNDATLPLLAEQAVSLVRAGADMVAPSGMMDGAVAAIRAALDQAGMQSAPIMGYSVKYASGMYGPFREAAEGAPQFGDRSSYQMDPANAHEALREAAADIAEGADILMVKPAMNYLDIISLLSREYPQMPLAAYQVSGEYAMIKAAAERGWLDETRVMLESLLAIKRAGANILITYFAMELARALQT